MLYAWDIQGYAVILKFQTAYNMWAENQTLHLQTNMLYYAQLAVCHERIEQAAEAVEILQGDREYAYDVVMAQQDQQAKQQKRALLKNILIGTGSGLAGVAIGLIVGFVAAQ